MQYICSVVFHYKNSKCVLENDQSIISNHEINAAVYKNESNKARETVHNNQKQIKCNSIIEFSFRFPRINPIKIIVEEDI